MSEHGLSPKELTTLRELLEGYSLKGIVDEVRDCQAGVHREDRRHFDRATAARVELFSRLRAPKSAFGKTPGKAGS
jgi:hypothetical protein